MRARMGDKRTSADIVFEYLSPSTSINDRTTKADTYLALGVRELWPIDPVTATIEIRHAHLEAEMPTWQTFVFSQGEHARSRVLEGWEVSVTEFFEGIVQATDTTRSSVAHLLLPAARSLLLRA